MLPQKGPGPKHELLIVILTVCVQGSNGCIHKNKVEKGGPEKAHWTCCGSMDITSVFCDVQS